MKFERDPHMRSIMFATEMVVAILAGRKTVTRRLVKEPKEATLFGRKSQPDRNFCDQSSAFGGSRLYRYLHWYYGGGDLGDDYQASRVFCQHEPRDRIWVRESWATEKRYDRRRPTNVPPTARVCYLADGTKPKWAGRTRNARFMPRKFTRLVLEVERVRPERLQNITEPDAKREGLPIASGVKARQRVTYPDGRVVTSIVQLYDFTARGAFCHLWDGLNEKRAPWTSDPWVWRIQFRIAEQTLRFGGRLSIRASRKAA